MNTSDRGAISELAVAVDLMYRGFEVFRALSPASSCDLIIYRDGKALRVEVKTDRRLAFKTHRKKEGSKFLEKTDIVAIPMEGYIDYYPTLPKQEPTQRLESCTECFG